jgi:peroxiredoxin
MLKEKQNAPEFTLDAMDGSQRSLSEMLAQGPVLLAFFKISCPVCQYTFPFLQRLHEAAAGQAVQFFGVSQDSAAATDFFLKDYGIEFPTLLDTYAGGYAVSNAYQIRSVPSAYLIEPDGTISLTMEGFEKAAFEALGERGGVAAFAPGEDVPAFRPG